MQEVGPVADADNVTQFKDNNWAVVFEEKHVIWVRYQDDDTITLSAEVGPLPNKDVQEFSTFLLVFNSLSQHQRSVRTGLDSEKGNCLIMMDYFADSLEVNQLAQLLAAFGAQYLHWKQLLFAWPETQNKASLIESIPLANPNFIRA